MHSTKDIDTYHLSSDDFEEIREADVNWDYDTAQLTPGPFKGVISGIDVSSLEISYNRWGRRVYYRGVPPAGSIALMINLNQSGQGTFAGEQVNGEDIFVQSADTEAEYFSAPLWESIIFVIPRKVLANYIADLTLDSSDNILKYHRVYKPTSEQLVSLRSAGRQILNTASGLSYEQADAYSLKVMADSIVEITALTLSELQVMNDVTQTNKTPSCRRQTELIRLALDYCHDHADQPLRIGDMCRELEVSERTLRYVFQKRINMSPLNYLKRIKLNQVYKKLRMSDYDQTMVKKVALENGFSHSGQFARDYKNLFSELPSQTLVSKRSYQKRYF